MLREIVERLGAGENLTVEEAEATLEHILTQEVEDDQIAKLLLAMADKGETAEEIAGFARLMRRVCVKIPLPSEDLVDVVGTGGGVDTFNVSTTAAFVIAGAGAKVAKHGNRAVTSKSGSADLLAALGVGIDRPPECAIRCLEEVGVAFFFAPAFHPAMKRVAAIRRRLGRRTIFNLLGPVTNPASAAYQLIGVYAPHLTESLAQALTRLGCRRAWVVHSRDGMDEISPHQPTQVSQVEGARVETFEFDPASVGLGGVDDPVPSGGSPLENAAVTLGLLEGRLGGSARAIVLLNAAAAVHLVKGGTFEESWQAAQDSLMSGRARGKLRQLIECTSDRT